MKKLIASVAAAVSFMATAAPVGYIGSFEPGEASLTLHNTPCVNEKALANIKEDFRKDFFHGEYIAKDGRHFTACWAMKNATIYISDEDGDVGRLPANLVQPLVKL